MTVLLLPLLLACPTPKPADSAGTVEDSVVHLETGDDSATTPTDSVTGDSVDSVPPPPDSLGALTLTVDPEIVTILHAAFTDPGVTDVWVEYRFDGADWQIAPLVGPGDAALLGIPAEMAVEARAAARYGATTVYSESATTTTGPLPTELLLPEVLVYDRSLADAAGYVMIAVDHGDYYAPPYWIEIFDREGRVVWYRETTDGRMTFYPTVARDGTHIWFDESDIFGVLPGEPQVVRQTLDGRWSDALAIPDLGQGVAEGPDGSFFYERRFGDPVGVAQALPDGSFVTIWDCAAWMAGYGYGHEQCQFNGTNWSEARNTVLASSFYADTIFEVDVATGTVLRQMGQFPAGNPYTFDPPATVFDYQHYPMWLDSGRILVSTPVLGNYGVQLAGEYEVDDRTRTVRRVWEYTSTDRFATQVGEALRLPGGNTVVGYGQDGAVREVTPAGEVAFDAAWPKDVYGYRVVGHASFIPDLYALNAGPE